MKYLVTGGLGFIGSAIVRNLVSQGEDVHVLDANTYAANKKRLEGVKYTYFKGNIRSSLDQLGLSKKYDYILHLAAETHVDRSIDDAMPFVLTNVVGTANVLEFARKQSNLKAFLYFSTDEVFGPAPIGYDYKETDRYNSGNPYAAAKAGGEELCKAYMNTYGIPVIITHTMNAFGPLQDEEKFIPLTIKKVLAGEKVIIHSDKTKTIPGSRFYIHIDNIAQAVDFIIKKGITGEAYNIVGEKEVNNLELAQIIATTLGKELNYELVDFHSSRPGHDLRYALDGTKMSELGWKLPKGTFEDSLREIITSYV